jgi:hypothetical protein
MSEQPLRPDQRIGFVCPVGGCIIDGLDASQTKDAPAPVGWQPPGDDIITNAASFAVAQNMQANEALILAHVESQHTVKQLLIALGVARNALQEIRETLATNGALGAATIYRLIDRGLGEQ